MVAAFGLTARRRGKLCSASRTRKQLDKCCFPRDKRDISLVPVEMFAGGGRWVIWADRWERQSSRSEAPARSIRDEIRTRVSWSKGRAGEPLMAPVTDQKRRITENRSVYAASRMSQLRKSSSAASRTFPVLTGHMGDCLGFAMSRPPKFTWPPKFTCCSSGCPWRTSLGSVAHSVFGRRRSLRSDSSTISRSLAIDKAEARRSRRNAPPLGLQLSVVPCSAFLLEP
jgi:hypothetical protein